MKGLYITPQLEIVEFLDDDILTSSLINGGEGSGPIVGDGDDEYEEITSSKRYY